MHESSLFTSKPFIFLFLFLSGLELPDMRINLQPLEDDLTVKKIPWEGEFILRSGSWRWAQVPNPLRDAQRLSGTCSQLPDRLTQETSRSQEVSCRPVQTSWKLLREYVQGSNFWIIDLTAVLFHFFYLFLSTVNSFSFILSCFWESILKSYRKVPWNMSRPSARSCVTGTGTCSQLARRWTQVRLDRIFIHISTSF